MAAETWQDIIMRATSRYFHERGLEPDIHFKEGQIVFNLPEGVERDEAMDDLMSGLQERLQAEVEAVQGRVR